MAHKTVETTYNVKNAFGPGSANEHTMLWWFRKFCKEDKSLEVEEYSSQPSAVDNNHLRVIIEADSLTTTEVAEELSVNNSMVVQHLKQIGKVKKLDKWVPHELTTSQNLLKCCLPLFYVTTTNFLIGLWHVIKSGFYMTTDEYQLSGWTKKKIQSFFQSQTCTHKSPCSLFHGLLPLWSTTTFWILVKPLHLRACSANLRQHVTAHCTTNDSKAEWKGLWNFASSTIFTWPLVNWPPLF